MNWLSKLLPSKVKSRATSRLPEGLWSQCGACHAIIYSEELYRNLNVCPKCQHHQRISARSRLQTFLDEATGVEIAKDIKPTDPLKFKDTKRYKERLVFAQKETGEQDALVVMQGKLCGMNVVVAAFEFEFIGGSMGSVVGEKFVQAAELCLKNHIPLVCFSASGGARMQEALFSLFQMAKTSAVLAQLSQECIPYISVLTNPTMGGVSASLAMLGDIILAEPNALIGFAGPRVIQQTVKQTLPEGFQTSEFLLEHGAIDGIIARHELRAKVAQLLAKLTHKVMGHEGS